MARKMIPHDGNSATAHIAHAVSETIAIYPITPSTSMGEISDEKSARGEANIWGTVPQVDQLQSEGGVAGAIHGALSTGSMATTFSASQGLLLMIPNMYKIAGELLPTVFHVSARALACQGLSIFGDHSDVMACRQIGWAMLASNSVQEAQDMALIAHATTLEARIPFIHFFDGFRTSHEIQKIEELGTADIEHMIDNDLVRAHRSRGLNPENPEMMGTAQNPDVYFTGRETVNSYMNAVPTLVQKNMDKFAKLTGRSYKIYEYLGAADAEKVIVIMGSGGEAIEETMSSLSDLGQKVGVLKVRLFRPVDAKVLVNTLPASVTKIAVLDRTKEPGSLGEPLYLDVRTAISEMIDAGEAPFAQTPKVVCGRYGLGSAEFTPAMVKAVFDNLDAPKPKNHFTIGIHDDVTHTSLAWDKQFNPVCDETFNAMFYGLGSDGTVGANKNSIKIIGENSKNYTQGYFEYDSKKSGALTTSHLRFGPKEIKSPYLITQANFLACHNFSFLNQYEMLKNLKEGGVFLLNSAYAAADVWQEIPGRVQNQIVSKKLKFYVVDGLGLAKKLGLGGRINMIMQTAFFKISGVMPEEEAVAAIKDAIRKTYGKKGESVVQMNLDAVDSALHNIEEVNYTEVDKSIQAFSSVSKSAPDFVKEVTAQLLAQNGTSLKVSQIPADGKWMTGTAQYEKRSIASSFPVWNSDACIQCSRCAFVCPHSSIRPKVYDGFALGAAPDGFKSVDAKGKDLKGMQYTLQNSAADCTGCGLCVEECPMKAKGALTMGEMTEEETELDKKQWDFFLDLPELDLAKNNIATLKGSQFIKPLFEFSGACAGCGETPYIKLVTQLFGDRAMIANATGCSSIYGGNLPTTPYTKRADGCGPVWNNSLFEDNAELAFGMRMTVDKSEAQAIRITQEVIKLNCLDECVRSDLKTVLEMPQSTQQEIEDVRNQINLIKPILADLNNENCKELLTVIDFLVKKSVWAFGGDGWAYDIGFGGLDHVMASGRNINILVMDTEVYSNTGGQSSKATPMGATAKFAANGKAMVKKDLGMVAMSYGYVYVAKVALSNPNQVLKAMIEAEKHPGPSLIMAYSHCVAHGIDMAQGIKEQGKAVKTGHWPLYRYNPAEAEKGKNPLKLDSKAPSMPLEEYALGENRYKILAKSNPEMSKRLLDMAQENIDTKFEKLSYLAAQEK